MTTGSNEHEERKPERGEDAPESAGLEGFKEAVKEGARDMTVATAEGVAHVAEAVEGGGNVEEVGEAMMESADGVASAAKDEARHIASHLRTQAKGAKEKAQAQAASSFEEQRGRVAREAEGFASALRETAERLEERDQHGVSVYVRSVANVTERIAGSIAKQELSGLAGGIDRIARTEPLLFFAGATALGFLASRSIHAAKDGVFEPTKDESETSGGEELEGARA